MIYVIIGLLILAVCGEPLFVIIGGVVLIAFKFILLIDPATMFSDFFRITTAPAMIAIPLFIFTGYLLAESKAPKRLINFSNALLGWMPGGLSLVALVSCAVFTAFTGASGITIVAIGAVLYPALTQEGYPEKFSLGLVTIGGGLGTLFLPCLPLVLYGVISQTSVEDLFIAGLIPGTLRIVLNLFYTTYTGRKLALRGKFSLSEVKKSVREIIWELPLPFLIVGGIFGGLFSAGEAAAIAAVYVLIVELFINRDIKLRDLGKIIRESMKMTGAIIVILGMALALTDIFIDQEIPMKIFEEIKQHIGSKLAFLLLLNGFLLIVGCLMDIFSACVVIVPIIVPIAKLYGIDPVHLGIIFLANLELGFITPPVGMSLFISSLKFKESYPVVVRSILPFFIICIIGLLLITYIPDISLFLLQFFSRKGLIPEITM